MAVLPNLQQQLSDKDARIAALEAALEAAKNAKPTAKVYWKVGRSGTISIGGFGKFPKTFYIEQWERLMEVAPKITEWAKTNPSTAYEKDEYGPAETVTLKRKEAKS